MIHKRPMMNKTIFYRIYTNILVLLGAFIPGAVFGDILWRGDFEDGTFKGTASNPENIGFWGVPEYGRPVQYGSQHHEHVGNGDLIWIAAENTNGNFKAGPRRGSNKHALALFVKSQQGGGTEPADCDNNNTVCSRRRSELRTWEAMWFNNMAPYGSERWGSISVHVPDNFQEVGSGFGPLLWQWKMEEDNGSTSPPLEFGIKDGSWYLQHIWNPDINPGDMANALVFNLSSNTPSGTDALKFFPEEAASRAALANLNVGGWTDFVFQIRFDGRTVEEGGQGFVRIWMRPDALDAEWVQVVDIVPSVTIGTWGGAAKSHGIMYKGDGEKARYGFVPTLYMAKDRAWGLTTNGHLFHFDNMKLGSENAGFEMMSHDGSSPGSSPPGGIALPRAPAVGVD